VPVGRPGGRAITAAGQPNVVLIVTDDVGYGDIGSYGAPDVKTPSIDSLARDGVKLTDFCAAPQCTPTRAALISGRYQQRFRLEAAPGPKTPAVRIECVGGRLERSIDMRTRRFLELR
jgi:arylsulfatase A-like enzyme